MTIEPGDLATLLPDFLVRQRWYGANDLELVGVEVSAFEVWLEKSPQLIWMLADKRARTVTSRPFARAAAAVSRPIQPAPMMTTFGRWVNAALIAHCLPIAEGIARHAARRRAGAVRGGVEPVASSSAS